MVHHKSYWRRSRITTKKGDSWDKLRLAIGSSKPWVSRSLRPWCVVFKPADVFDPCVQFSWGGNRVSVDMDRFHLVMHYTKWALFPPGTTPILIRQEPGIRIVMSTTTVDFHDDDPRFTLSVPTKLVVEAVRMFHRRILYSSNIHHLPKRFRGRRRRYRNRKHKAFVRMQGSHLRWTATAQAERAIEHCREHADQWPTDPSFRSPNS